MKLLAPLLLILALFGAWLLMGRPAERRVVVYCAHDAVFAEPILRAFQAQSGITVDIRYDTEATKSLGLTERLVAEAGAPQCDVFWNNELLGTLDLAAKGLLAEHRGSGWQRIPAAFKDPAGQWTGMGARLRVVLVNRERMAVPEHFPAEPDWSQGAMAKPLFGTTLTHVALLWSAGGYPEWHERVRTAGLRQVDGNGAVKDLVARGDRAWGYTDSDDALGAIAAGAPVTMLPLELGERTVAIPNTIAVLNGAPHAEAARQLADYLLSAATETALAQGDAAQIPLGPVDDAALPERVRTMRPWAARGHDLGGLLPARNAALAWLKAHP